MGNKQSIDKFIDAAKDGKLDDLKKAVAKGMEVNCMNEVHYQ